MTNVQTRLVRDAALGVWFAVATLAFWGPYVGLVRWEGTPVYGLFLTASAAVFALGMARRPAVSRIEDAEGAQHG